MMKAKCVNKVCKYEWDYKGFKPFYATCPSCYHKVPLNRTPEEVEVIMRFKRGEDEEEET